MTMAVDDTLSAAATISAEAGASPAAAAIAVSASMVTTTWASPSPNTSRRMRRMRSNDSSRPMVNRSTTTPKPAIRSIVSTLLIAKTLEPRRPSGRGRRGRRARAPARRAGSRAPGSRAGGKTAARQRRPSRETAAPLCRGKDRPSRSKRSAGVTRRASDLSRFERRREPRGGNALRAMPKRRSRARRLEMESRCRPSSGPMGPPSPSGEKGCAGRLLSLRRPKAAG